MIKDSDLSIDAHLFVSDNCEWNESPNVRSWAYIYPNGCTCSFTDHNILKSFCPVHPEFAESDINWEVLIEKQKKQL